MYKYLQMEGYISPDKAAAPGGGVNRGLTSPNQPSSAAAFGEMQHDVSSRASSSLLDADEFGDPDTRRDTFSNEGAIVSRLDPSTEQHTDSVNFHTTARRKPEVLHRGDIAT